MTAELLGRDKLEKSTSSFFQGIVNTGSERQMIQSSRSVLAVQAACQLRWNVAGLRIPYTHLIVECVR
jgi:hypothetical protein